MLAVRDRDLEVVGREILTLIFRGRGRGRETEIGKGMKGGEVDQVHQMVVVDGVDLVHQVSTEPAPISDLVHYQDDNSIHRVLMAAGEEIEMGVRDQVVRIRRDL